ncbi:molybdopterin-dependent oxidoreductase [Collimonas antrihumi]|uniref:molybdopterin-dependent oxidoreductase n=1 Tax=Collimonas antrihumi TaxID=1940615 RepID=UPI001B8B50B2|nr:molybdopterin-dependent oxidoreductase [Collimonas antrihumi]
MKKRQFLSTATASIAGALGMIAVSPDVSAAAKGTSQAAAPAVLTITGAIERSNRGPTDPVIDQMMHKQNVQFSSAFAFDLGALAKLPAATINPTMEYDSKPHQLRGPRLADVLDMLGASKAPETQIVFHSVDGYMPQLSFAQLRKYGYILATHIDGKPMSIGGFGPIFAIYDADRIAEQAQKPLSQRFTLCPWGLYCIEVVAGK